MNTIHIIIQKFFNQDKIFVLNKNNLYDFWNYICINKYNNDLINHLFYYYFFNSKNIINRDEYNLYYIIYNKLNTVKQAMSNIFLSEIQKNQFLEKFSKMQRIYYGFAKLGHIYRLKKSKVQINTDLCLNELNPN